MTYIIDAMSVVYAGYFSALSSKTYNGASGTPYYKRAISHFLPFDKQSPTYVCWEGMKSTAYRKNLNESYKSNRKWDPEVLKAIDAMKSLCEENNYKEISVDGLQWELTPRLLWIGGKIKLRPEDTTSRRALQPQITQKTIKKPYYLPIMKN